MPEKALRYVGIVDGGGDVWGVVIPDFPGCHGGGPSPAQAVEDATRALREFAADMIARGEDLPEATDLGDIMEGQKSGAYDAGATVFVPLLIDRNRVVKANITVDAAYMAAIDQAARERGMTRSKFLVTSALERIARGD